jgi:hypothetical protein
MLIFGTCSERPQCPIKVYPSCKGMWADRHYHRIQACSSIFSTASIHVTCGVRGDLKVQILFFYSLIPRLPFRFLTCLVVGFGCWCFFHLPFFFSTSLKRNTVPFVLVNQPSKNVAMRLQFRDDKDEPVHKFINPYTELNIGLWSLFAGASIFLWARLWVKITRRHGMWYDDYILIVSWVSSGNVNLWKVYTDDTTRSSSSQTTVLSYTNSATATSSRTHRKNGMTKCT